MRKMQPHEIKNAHLDESLTWYVALDRDQYCREFFSEIERGIADMKKRGLQTHWIQ